MCGILGLYHQGPATDIAKLTFFGLLSLQHRGQEGCGIAVSNGDEIQILKQNGMVSQVFHEKQLSGLIGKISLGHTRYSTYGKKDSTSDLQPLKIFTSIGSVAISFNGTLTKADTLRNNFLNKGYGFQTNVDTELIAQLLCQNENDKQTPLLTWADRIRYFTQKVDAAFSACFMTNSSLFVARDRFGFRPLIIGRFNNTENHEHSTFVVSSESCSLQTLGAEILYEVQPGEIIEINETGLHFLAKKSQELIPRKFCAFETVYFARPDSEFDGKLVHSERLKLGSKLYHENQSRFESSENYLVAGVPDSATPFAMGFIDSALDAKDTRFRLTDVFTKNRYIHRTFIQPTETMRKTAVQSKFNPLPQNVNGKRIILIDDSIVRGNTMTYLIQLLRDAGALEVHVLVGSPPLKFACYMGIDMKGQNEFIANRFDTPEEIGRHLGADSISYLTLEGMKECLDSKNEKGHCFSCWTGEYADILDW